jgi:hypothetical protein
MNIVLALLREKSNSIFCKFPCGILDTYTYHTCVMLQGILFKRWVFTDIGRIPREEYFSAVLILIKLIAICIYQWLSLFAV